MTRRRRTPNSDQQSGPSNAQPQQSSDRLYSCPLLWLLPATCTLVCTYDNFQEAWLLDAWKGYQELSTGIAEALICLFIMAVKVYEFPMDPLIKLPTTCRANFSIYRDTTVIVIISYVLLLDISLSNLWLSIFPAIAIVFIWMLCIKLCATSEGGEQADSSKGNHVPSAPGSKKALKEMTATAFSFFALLGMAQLDDSTVDRFAISQFLLFLSTTLGALTNMMMRLPAGISPGIEPASELLHKAFLLLVLVTLHTVAAEAITEDMVWICLLELFPVLMWYGVHLDRDSSIISIDKIKPHKNEVCFGVPPSNLNSRNKKRPIPPLPPLKIDGVSANPGRPYVFSSGGLDKRENTEAPLQTDGVSANPGSPYVFSSGGLDKRENTEAKVHKKRCASVSPPLIQTHETKNTKNSLIAISSAVVIALLSYLATSMDEFGLSSCTSVMLACGVSGILTYYVVFMLHQWPGQQSAVSNNVQSEEQAGSSEEAVQLLIFWANALLIVAAAMLLLKYVVARRVGLEEPLLNTLCRDFRLCR